MPNPQSALPLPPRPSIERYRRLAKELTKASKSSDPAAISTWVELWVNSLARHLKLSSARTTTYTRDVLCFLQKELAKLPHTLTTAQFLLARCHGFKSWPVFTRYLQSVADKSSAASRFEAAADAIVHGKYTALKRLLNVDPTLVHARSQREHQATLLHYVSANGVENYRQLTPKNIVRITKLLLDYGAAIDATADVYGGNATTLGLAATSVHPELAGVQEPLLKLLLDRGAQINHPKAAGNNHPSVLGSLANGRPKAAVFLAEHGASLSLVEAAGVGRLDLVQTHYPQATPAQRISAMLYAAHYGRNPIVQFLFDQGHDLASHDGDGQTALHYAVIGGQPETVDLLLSHNPPLEAQNAYGGAPLGQALWSAAHGGHTEIYLRIIDKLIAAGVHVPSRHVPVNPIIDTHLLRYNSHPEPSWHWFGEGPPATPK